MALARLCLSKHLAAGRALPRPQHAASPVAAVASCHGPLSFHAFFSSAAADAATTTTGGGAPAKGDGRSREVAVVNRSRRRWPWRDLRDFVPFRLVDGIGSALSQVAETLTRPLERLAPPSSWRRPLTGKVREDEERYRLRFEVPGLGKDDVRVYVEDGVLVIHGEKREVVEEERGGDGDDDGEWWAAAAATYGSYHAGLILPEDARAEGITAEVRDGVLHVTVPRSPERKRSVTEVKVQ